MILRKNTFHYCKQKTAKSINKSLVDTHLIRKWNKVLITNWAMKRVVFLFFFPKSGGVGIFYSTYDFKIQEEIKVENTGNVYALSMSIVKRKLSPL